MRASIRLLGLAFLAAAALSAAPSRAQDVPITPEAREHFVAGVRMLKDPAGPRYEEAYQEFKTAYARSPSARILGNVGLCAMRLERDEEAIAAYEKYLAGVADLDASERKQIEADLATLKASLVRLTITVDVADVRIVDARTPVQGAQITNVYGPFATQQIQLGIHAGHHVITVKRDGYAPATWDLDPLPGSQATRAFTLQKLAAEATPPAVPAQPPQAPPRAPAAPDKIERPTPGAVYFLAVLSGAALLGGVITGTTALQKKSAYDEANTGRSPAEAEKLKNTGQALNIATDVLLGSAIVGAGIATILYVTRPSVKVPATSAAFVRLRVGPSSFAPAGAAFEGVF